MNVSKQILIIITKFEMPFNLKNDMYANFFNDLSTRIPTENFYFTYLKDSPFRWIIFWRDVMGLHNDVSCRVTTLYISYILYIQGLNCVGCTVGVTAGSLICCRLFCWDLGDIKIELSNMYRWPIVCNSNMLNSFTGIFYSTCCRI